MEFSVVDLIIAGIFLISFLIGIFRGLVKEALSLVSWFAAIFIAGLFGDNVADMLTGVISSSSLRSIAGFALLFIGTVFIGGFISNAVSKLTTAAGLKGTDRVLGALFGIVRALVIVVIIIMMTMPFEMTRQWYEDSLAVPYLMSLAEYLQDALGLAPDSTA